MIDYEKNFSIDYLNTDDIFLDLKTPVNKRNNCQLGEIPKLPIYYYQFFGIQQDENSFYKQVYNLKKHFESNNIDYLEFKHEIECSNDDIYIKTVNNLFNNVITNEDLNIESLLLKLKDHNALPKLSNKVLNSTLYNGLLDTLKVYKENNNYNSTQIKNFFISMVFLINTHLKKILKKFNYKSQSSQDIYNPKILYFGEIKKINFYFLFFLTHFGFDVIIFDTEKKNITKEYFKSNIKRASFDNFCYYNDSKLKIEDIQKKTEKPERIVKTVNKESYSASNESLEIVTKEIASACEKSIIISVKKSNDIFLDFKSSLNSRIGYKSGDRPIIPCYFYRLIGVPNEDEYFNKLYNLNKKLAGLKNKYIKIENSIPFTINDELKSSLELIIKEYNNVESLSKIISFKILKGELIKNLDSDLIKNSLISSLGKVNELYKANEGSSNIHQYKNFIVKILCWCEEYLRVLFRNSDFGDKATEVFNPKVIYFGDIKKHEIYFLLLLNFMGADVLYINFSNDELSEKLPLIENYSKIMIYENTSSEEYPKAEKYVRKETVAFKASREITNAVFTENDGFYKPWQLQDYVTVPLTLKTTYEEVKIFWNEPARFRPGFRVENNKVYIPNIFSKVSGVHKDINQYWQELSNFKTSENTMFYTKIPLTTKTISRNDLFCLLPSFNSDGTLERTKLLDNKFYKFKHLKVSHQNNIIDKINILIKDKRLIKHTDQEFILRIVMSIFNIDEQIVQLIQKFDYPDNIPKIVIYHGDNNIFNTEDGIIISFLNLLGFDILIFTPTGYTDIENELDSNYYDIHSLEDIKFNLNLQDMNSTKQKLNSLFGKILKN